jgi:tungstate transport system ATP-binding protein
MATALNGAHKLEARGLVVRRGGRTILDVDALSIASGEVLAVIGPNGAGKSTLLLHLALLERPENGQIVFDGAAARGRELALRRKMAVVFQDPLLLDRTVLANVETGLRLRGVTGPQRRERARRWLSRFGVEALSSRSSRTLSGGEAQRVSLARAFALEPEVLLLDEPFSALDRPTREAITQDLAVVLAETRMTTILVTHDHDEAARMGHRIAVLMRGCIVQSGSPSDVFGAPATEEVAAFVGIETMIRATVVGYRDGLVVLAAGVHQIEAIGDPGITVALVCLRPEDISISPVGEASPGSARNRMAGRINRIVPTGADCRVEMDCSGVTMIARVTRRSIDELSIGVGSGAIASFKATAVHLIPLVPSPPP